MSQPMKILTTQFSPRERYIVWLHLEKNVSAMNGREQEQIDDIRQTLHLEQIEEITNERPVDIRDFADTASAGPAVPFGDPAAGSPLEMLICELTKEELAFFLALLVKPMPAGIAKYTLPIKRRLEKERDTKGMKAVETPPAS
jgi:hypothetical protein